MAKDIFILKNKLPLVITTGLLASLPVLPVIASQELNSDSQWVCKQAIGGKGWQCSVIPRTEGPIPFAQRAPVQPALEKSPGTPVEITGGFSPENKGAAASSAPAPEKTRKSEPAVPVAVTPAAVTPAEKLPGYMDNGRPLTVSQAYTTLDWRPIDQLPQAQKNLRKNRLCGGGYDEPSRPGQDYQGDPAKASIYAEADKSSYHEGGIATLSGNVLMRQGYRQIESNVAHMNRNTSEADFEVDVVIREPNLLLIGNKAKVNTDSGYAEIHDADYVFHQDGIRGEAKKIIRHEDETIELDNATYTTCPPEGCVWQLNGRKVKLDREAGMGTATHATVDILGLPVFYTPWITFPIDDRRKSGLLFPTLSYSSGEDSNGFDYTQPIYWNIAPNMDATITPRVMSNRGALIESEFRMMTGSSMTELGGAYSTKDKIEQKNLNYDQNRWMVNLNHTQNLTKNWDYEINFTNASDREYFSDFATSLDVNSQSPLVQQIYTNYQSSGDGPHQWNLNVGTQHLKNMSQDADDPYDKAVDLTLNGKWGEATGFGFNYVLAYTDFQREGDWQYKRQDRVNKEHDIYQGVWGKGAADSITNATGGRLYAETGVSYRFENSYAFLEPGVKWRSVHYRLGDLKQAYADKYVGSDLDKAKSPDTNAPTAYLDGGMYFDRPTAFGDLKLTQTLEPRFRYVYTPYRGSQGLNPDFDSSDSTFSYSSLWRDDRFSGYDRIGDTNHVSLGITSRFLEENGFERFRFSIGQMFYFEDRKVYIDPRLESGENDDTNLTEENERLLAANKANRSPIASQMVWNIRRDLRLTQDWIYNTDQSWNQEYATGLQYLPQPGAVFNMGYRYRNQVDRAEKYKDGLQMGNNTGKYVNGNLEEASISAVWPLANQWSVFGRYSRDLTNKRHMDRSFGFEQDSCCYKMRVMYRNWIDPDEDIDTAETDKGIFFEFVLKGLGNITSSKVADFLKGVSGYSSRK